jgi:hypothetical protein
MKKGSLRTFDLTLGDPCTCIEEGTKSDENTTLLLVYYVLERLLFVEQSDHAICAVPNLSLEIVSRVLNQPFIGRARALRVDCEVERSAYQRDPSDASGDLDFALTLGATDAHPMNAPLHATKYRMQVGGMPPIFLGLGNETAAESIRGNVMVPVDSTEQTESVWVTALRRRRRPRPGDIFGQSSLPSGSSTSSEVVTPDPFWSFARDNTGPALFPWRRELPAAERVALLTRDDLATRPLVTTPGLDDQGRRSSQLHRLPKFPFSASGGRIVVAEGTVLPAGFGVRHPALAVARSFRKAMVEYLSMWAHCGDVDKCAAYGHAADRLWTKHRVFRKWVRSVYACNRARAAFLVDNPSRLTVTTPDGRFVQVKVSQLATGLHLKRLVAAKLQKDFPGAVLVFEGVPIDDRTTLRDAGVRARSTVSWMKLPAHMPRGDIGLPLY